ncbi:hypothetical protein IQ07DRAFT_481875, partial [Pyrenochaeta sp. DS3sAY3a]
GLKLRDCCQSCARSKVRCTKEKPACSRCDTKGIACVYLRSKRPGRIPGSGARRAKATPPSPRDCTRASISPTADTTSTEDLVSNILLSPISVINGSLLPDNAAVQDGSFFDGYDLTLSPDMDFDADENVPFAWDDCLDVLATMNDPLYGTLMDWDTTTTALPVSLQVDPSRPEDLSGSDSGPQSPTSRLLASTHTSYSASSSSTSISSLSSLRPMSLSRTATSTVPSTNGHARSPSKQQGALIPPSHKPTPRVVCNCLEKALDLLKAITKDPCAEMSLASGGPATQAILTKNKEVIQATLAILSCVSCLEDRLLIMVLLLITMKMLPRYASAAALTSCASPTTNKAMESSTHDSISLGNGAGNIDDRTEMYPRQAKQHVLRELHLVQRLITQLSSRLKGLSSSREEIFSVPPKAQASIKPSNPNKIVRREVSNDERVHPTPGDTELMPLSTRTLDLVENDVRKSLSSLSAVVRNALKDS